MSYQIWKLIHVLAVVAFLGNITTGVFWGHHAHRSGDPRLIAATFRGIIASDRWFTNSGVIVLVVAGILAAVRGGFPILGTGWILWSLVLLVISGIAFAARIAPQQRRIVAIASGTWDQAAYQAAYRSWQLWGALGLMAPLLATALMVLKPVLPAN